MIQVQKDPVQETGMPDATHKQMLASLLPDPVMIWSFWSKTTAIIKNYSSKYYLARIII